MSPLGPQSSAAPSIPGDMQQLSPVNTEEKSPRNHSHITNQRKKIFIYALFFLLVMSGCLWGGHPVPWGFLRHWKGWRCCKPRDTEPEPAR